MKHSAKFFQLILIVLTVSILAGCNQSTGGQHPVAKPTPPSAAVDAIKALRKIEAATQVSINYLQYSQLVIDAKAQVNEASAALPDGELKSEIKAAMDAYADAGVVWAEQVQGSRALYSDLPPGKTLVPKYSLTGAGQDIIRARAIILEAAHKHLDRASKILQQ